MAVVRAKNEEVKLLARLMRAEAEGEGKLGMLMVGNVGINRVRVDCLDFRPIRGIRQMVFQHPGGFEATLKPYFYQRARSRDVNLARKAIRGEKYHPATHALWFHSTRGACRGSWYGQRLTGRYKAHCFFSPTGRDCPSVYR